MRPIVYLASYPRSGNTFLRALLANYLSDAQRPATPNEVAHFGAGEKHEELWLESTGLGWRERTLEIEWTARLDYLNRVRDRPGSGPIFLKTHTINGMVFGAPAFAFRPEDRIVYIVRHPLDVLVSGSQFFGIDLEAMAERLVLSGAYNTSGGGYFEVTGSWVEHVGGWTTETRCPVLLVTYEALCADAGAELARVLDHAGIPVSVEKVARAVADAAFDGMKARHALEGFDQGPDRDPRHPFFRIGRPGQWKSELPAPVIDRVYSTLGPVLHALGYSATGGPLIAGQAQVPSRA